MPKMCRLKLSRNRIEFVEETNVPVTGKLSPNSGNTFNILIREDNPDIHSLTTEKRLTEQACMELEKQIGYKIKIWGELDDYPRNLIDITIDFKNDDPFFQSNTLAWAGYPNGSLRGQMVFNNKFIWLDGYDKTGRELMNLGLELPGMRENQKYTTYNYKQTLKHEIGHSFGLPHTADPTDNLNAFYRADRIMYGEESKETLNTKYGKASILRRMLPDSYIRRVMVRPI